MTRLPKIGCEVSDVLSHGYHVGIEYLAEKKNFHALAPLHLEVPGAQGRASDHRQLKGGSMWTGSIDCEMELKGCPDEVNKANNSQRLRERADSFPKDCSADLAFGSTPIVQQGCIERTSLSPHGVPVEVFSNNGPRIQTHFYQRFL